MSDRFDGRWQWCDTCDCAAVVFPCGDASCTGHTCPECHEESVMVSEQYYRHGKQPKSPEGLKHFGGAMKRMLEESSND